MKKTKELEKIIKKLNKIADKKYGNIDTATEEDKVDFVGLVIKVLLKNPKMVLGKEVLIKKTVQVLTLYTHSGIPKKMFDKYADEELDYIIDFCKKIISGLKNENN